MKKYFYTNGIDKIGPFSIEELEKQNINKETKVWFYGLDNWTALSDVDELKSIANSIPPELKVSKPKETNSNNKKQNAHLERKIERQNLKNKKYLRRGIIISVVSILVILIAYITYNNQQDIIVDQQIISSAYDTDVDFDFYVDKFYRDAGVYGIFPKKPLKKVIKFAKFDHIDNATHIHGISYGSNDDDRIEIYINPSTWQEFNKPLRYYLMYHELAHDVLNLDDLEEKPINEGKLMYPAISSYEYITMDDFIENSHTLFKEVAANQ